MADIYLDNAAATPLAPQARRAMMQATKSYGNPSSFNDAGRAAAGALQQARISVAKFLHAREDEIVFCSSGSEANALALGGVVRERGEGAIVTAPTEHLSVLETCQELQGEGREVRFVGVDEVGRVRVEDVMAMLSTDVTVVSLMYANNEIGTIHDIARIGRAITQWRKSRTSSYPLFHVDACQATTTLPMDVQRLGVDLLTLNGAKAYGPHGSAALFVRRGVSLRALVRGGSQERGRRAGTEDVASASGLASALMLITPDDATWLEQLRDYFIDEIMTHVADVRINGPIGRERSPSNIHISIPGCTSEELLLELDRLGVHAGSGSACTAHRVEPSHVLVAIGTPVAYLEGALRFSLGRSTTKKDLARVAKALPGIIERIRSRKARAS
ncbi:MAG: cysteine desulfurase [Candidatus Pacebacteria bacterium]|nr:cysteine desulfurase [Candidatus Paceibacterota bacterium]